MPMNPIKWTKNNIIALSSIAAILVIIIVYFAFPFPKNYLGVTNPSTKIFDRHGQVLMELTPDNAGIYENVALEEVPQGFIRLLVFSEDKNFYTHAGIYLPSFFRAIFQNITSGKVVSGGSTISQQLIKLKRNLRRNNIFTKFTEIFQALKLEMHFSKNDIMQAYLNNVFMGNHIYGIKKAVKVYFNKDIAELSMLESAAIIEALKSPTRNNLFKHSETVEIKAKRLLRRAGKAGIVSSNQLNAVLGTRLDVFPGHEEIYAPHFCFWALDKAKALVPDGERIAELHTTFDLELYNEFIEEIRNRMTVLKKRNANNSSLLMVDNKTSELRVMIGSIDFFEEDGQINGTIIRRQPGSTMKPFTYALALEKKAITPASILPDIYSEFPSMVGKYIPRNYDERFHGPVRAGVALGSSYNVPAVHVLSKAGFYDYYALLKRLGMDSLDRSAGHYGMGLTLGNADITLLELLRAYTVFPNGGNLYDIDFIYEVKTASGKKYFPKKTKPKRIFSPETAFLINHILSDFSFKTPAFGVNSPLNFPFPIAVKTGTTKNFRDNSVVGYNKDYTIGIWTGNFSGEPMRDMPSASGSGLLFRDIILLMYNKGMIGGESFKPEGKHIAHVKICELSGMKAGKHCTSRWEYFLTGTEPKEECDWHKKDEIVIPEIYEEWAVDNLISDNIRIDIRSSLRVISPRDDDRYRIDPYVSISNQQVKFRAISRFTNVNWYVNEEFYKAGNTVWWTLTNGTFKIRAEVEDGTADERTIIVIM